MNVTADKLRNIIENFLGHPVSDGPCGPSCTCFPEAEEAVADEMPAADGPTLSFADFTDFIQATQAGIDAERAADRKAEALANLSSLLQVQGETIGVYAQMIDEAFVADKD
jgi:hypothetical protein